MKVRGLHTRAFRLSPLLTHNLQSLGRRKLLGHVSNEVLDVFDVSVYVCHDLSNETVAKEVVKDSTRSTEDRGHVFFSSRKWPYLIKIHRLTAASIEFINFFFEGVNPLVEVLIGAAHDVIL